MSTLKRLIGSSLFVFLLAVTTLAQESRAPMQTHGEAVAPLLAAPLVTASATATRVRFVSPGTVVQLRLEVYNETGQKLFDTELRGGNVLDWHLQDGAGERLAPGSYATVLTIKSLSGRLSQRVGRVTVSDQKAMVEGAGQLSLAQQQTIGPVEDNAAFKVLPEMEAEAITTVTHDGSDGQLSRTRGALSFGVGNFFAGKDKEQMRLTEAGNLGIGTDQPAAKLDVAGAIRTSGIEFVDGTDGKVTKLTTTATGALQQTLADGTVVENATGTGTQHRVAKWIDNVGTLGDSTITEVSGRVGIGATNPTYKLVVGPDIGAGLSTSDLTVSRGAGQSVSAFIGASGANGMNFGWDQGNTRAFVNAPVLSPIVFTHGGVSERLRIGTNGNIGIGTTNPTTKLDVVGNIKASGSLTGATGSLTGNLTVDTNTLHVDATNNRVGIGTLSPVAKLDVAGAVNTSTQYNIGGSRVLSNAGIDNLFAGPGSSTNTGNNNSFFGSTAGQANTSASGNSFFGFNAGKKNTTGDSNAFFGKNAGLNNTNGPDNSFFGANAGAGHGMGGGNSYFGSLAGNNSTVGDYNSYFGLGAGGAVGTGSNNSFFGAIAGHDNTAGSDNVFLGYGSGYANTTGNGNTIIGKDANVGAVGLSNATAIGYRAKVAVNNALVLGSIQGENNAEAGTNVGIGTMSPTYKLHVVDSSNQGLRVQTNSIGGTVASFAANGDFQIDATSIAGGRFIVKENGNVGIGIEQAPSYKLEVNGSVAGVGPYQDISDLRFKKDIHPLTGALGKVMRLRGVSFDWRRDEFPALNFSQGRQVGFIAQEIAGVLPEAVTTDNQGYYRMAYAEVTPILVEAIKEQQQAMEKLRLENNQLKALNSDTVARLAVLETTVKRMAHPEQNCQRVVLSTTPFLFRAIRLYERAGFKRTDDAPHDLFGTPLFTMVK